MALYVTSIFKHVLQQQGGSFLDENSKFVSAQQFAYQKYKAFAEHSLVYREQCVTIYIEMQYYGKYKNTLT